MKLVKLLVTLSVLIHQVWIMYVTNVIPDLFFSFKKNPSFSQPISA